MDAPPGTARRLADAALALLFLAGICAPLLLRVATGEVDESVAREQRVAAPRPQPPRDRASLDAFPAAYDAWLGDTFRLRGTLIRWHNAVKLLGFGVSPAPNLIVGKDGWLFLDQYRAIDCWRGIDPFTEAELERWRLTLEGRRDWCAARDMEYRFLVAPNKHTVYPEYLPGWLERAHPLTRLDQLTAHMDARSDSRVLDVRAELEAAKSAAVVYFPHGTHWNDRGAYVAYVAILESLGRAPLPLDAFDVQRPIERIPDWTGDTWATSLHLEDLVRQEAPVLAPRAPRRARIAEHHMARAGMIDGTLEHPDATLPSALMLRDSFANWLWPFLGEHFSRLTLDADRRFEERWIEDAGVDIVLEEMVERRIMEDPPAPPPADELRLARAWLAAEPVGASDGGPLLVRAQLASEAPATLALRWRGAEGAERSLELAVRAGVSWHFVPLDDAQAAGTVSLDEGARVEVRAFEVRRVGG